MARQELKKIFGEDLHLSWKIALITITSTLLLMVDHYRVLTGNKYYDRVILYLFIPLLMTLLIFREHPKEYGLTLGDWKLGIAFTLIGCAMMTPVIYYLARGDSQTRLYYAILLPGLPWTTFLNLIGWEFFFRGWILFGYARKFGAEALWLQAVPFALAHMGKPEIETFSTLFGGFAFGWVAWRTKSFLYPFLIHWYISTLIIWVAAGVS